MALLVVILDSLVILHNNNKTRRRIRTRKIRIRMVRKKPKKHKRNG